MTIERIPDHADRAVDRLPAHQRTRQSIEKMIRAITAPVQEVEDALFSLLLIASVDSASGDALDKLGRIVGQPRNGLWDADYRVWIRARQRVNRSSGTIPELLAVLRSIFPPEVTVSVSPEFPAGLRIRARGVELRNPDAVAALIKEACAGGIQTIFDFLTASPAETFTLDDGPGYDDGHLADAIEI